MKLTSRTSLAITGAILVAPFLVATPAMGESAAPPLELSLRNARAGTPYKATIAAVAEPGARFRKARGAPWVKVAPDGTITGTPPNRSATTKVTVREGDERFRFTIRVRQSGDPLVQELKVLSFNLWHGGSRINDYRAKQQRFLLSSGADAVGIQENNGAAKELATALGWDYLQTAESTAVISRYPITKRRARGSLPGINARIQIDDQTNKEISLWNVHLGYNPYGPYDMCFGKMTKDQLLAREEQSGRTPQIKAVLEAMKKDLDDSATTPVLLTGDFNAPSHLDYTGATASKHCGYENFPWPTSVLPENAGLIDSFRAANSDPAQTPGNTWSPIFPVFEGGYGYDDHKGEPEPQDRIDFVHYGGALSVTSSARVVVGDPKPSPDYEDNEWTSDHAAVLTTFTVG